jgi:iron complex outermembrane receptor protein
VRIGCGGRVQTVTTNHDGRFSTTLPAGDYLLAIDSDGFAPYAQVIHVSSSLKVLDVKLALAGNASTVEVHAAQGYVANDSVTATKTDTPLLETPQSIYVITRNELDAQAPQTLNEALRYAPAIKGEAQGTAASFWSFNNILLRGFNPTVFQDGLSEDATGNSLLDPYFYQRIEVLEGPSSTLYGQGSPAGIINTETKRPLASSFREVQLGFGTFGRYQGAFDFSGPLLSQHLLYRLTGVFFDEGSQVWFNHSKRRAVAPVFTWIPDNRTSLTVLGNYTYNPEVGPYTGLPAIGTALYNPNGRIATGFFMGDPNYNLTKQSFFQAGDVFTRTFGHDWQIGQNFRFTGNKDNAHMMWPVSLAADGMTLSRYAFNRHIRLNSVLSDNRLSKTVSTGHLRQSLLAGVNYTNFDELWHYGSNLSGVPSINLFHPVYYQTIPAAIENGLIVAKNHQTGIYFQDQASIGRLRLVFTGRQDWISLHSTTGVVGGAQTTTQYNPSAFTVRAGASYLVGRGFAPYFSYATSFQPNTAVSSDGSLLHPVTAKQYEGGLKYQPEHTNVLVTAAIYDLTEQNVAATDPNNPSFSIAIGEIESKGFELQGRTSLAHRLSLTSSYTFTSSRYTKTPILGSGYDGVRRAVQGNYQYAVPRNMANLFLDYSIPRLNGLGVSAGSRFIGSSFGDNVNSFLVHGATVFDTALHYDFGSDAGWLHGARLQLNGSNLGNRTYVSSCTTSTTCYYGLKRTAYGTASYRW